MYFQDEEDNLCNYYLLPLLKLNKDSFGEGNFINSYVDEKNGLLLVKVKDKDIEYKYYKNENFKTDYREKDNEYHIVFYIPSFFYNDLERFTNGKYSQLSTKAKFLIKTYSGLSSNRKSGNKNKSDFRILVLSRHPELKRRLEKITGSEIEDGAELASKPFNNNFVNLKLE